ncbi:DsbA family oxidoreductase [Microbispora sp. RL4-1S]|uniref:DsbA family oxidoreductase n=1 Tax=Microbispora oryzae TaxID=2806554 RepID=A0A940WRL8_9ACTN|nr:DsbA family oxidoreductase [Microbispora oryzae]MBP2706185.1 DsbA family oxidoreductase [Microbispora oryzae]
MRVEVWSDVVCPWCYIGKRRLEKAVERFEHAENVEVVWRSFQLDPSHAKGVRMPVYDMLAAKTGGSAEQVRAMTDRVKALAADEGLTYDFDRAVAVNTLDAHRVIHLAGTLGLGAEAHERLLRAHLIEGETVDDHETLTRLATEVGVPEDDARRVLAGDEYARDVEGDFSEARALGITGVPFFVLDRAYGVSGAQPVDTLLAALTTAYEREGTPAR